MEYKRLNSLKLKEYINKRVHVQFMARDIEVKPQRDKTQRYISLHMCDKKVCAEAKMFGVCQKQIDELKNGAIYNAAVDIKAYDKGAEGISCILYNFEEVAAKTADFLNWIDGREDSVKDIEEYLEDIQDTVYGRLVYEVLARRWRDFNVWTAAKSVHHSELGGLVAHTAEVTKLGVALADALNEMYYDGFINTALLISVSLLHDIGKIDELKVDFNTSGTEYSAESALVNHTIGAIVYINRVADEIYFGTQVDDDGDLEIKSVEVIESEREALKLITHCIAAHHGTPEMGSAMTASVPEAMLLHSADMVSAGAYMYNSRYENLEVKQSCTSWIAGKPSTVYKDSTKSCE